MARRWLLLAGLLFSWASVAHAQTITLVGPRGLSGSLPKTFTDALKRELGKGAKLLEASVAGKKALEPGDLSAILGESGAAFGLDAAAGKKKFSVLVVNASGDVVFQKTISLPKSAKKQKGPVADVAKAAGKAIKKSAAAADTGAGVAQAGGGEAASGGASAAAPATTEAAAGDGADPFASGAPAWAGAGGATTASSASSSKASKPADSETPAPARVALADDDDDDDEVTKVERSSSRSRRSKGLKLGVAPAAGVVGWKDEIDSTNDFGDRTITVSLTPQFGGSLLVEVGESVAVSVGASKRAAKLEPKVGGETQTIKASGLAIDAGVTYDLTDGDFEVGVSAGVAYETLTVDDQPDVLWIPAHTLLAPYVGAVLHGGDLATEGIVPLLAVSVTPWGSHERDVGFKVKSSVLGGRARAGLRYQLPRMLGDSAGLFFEGAGIFDYSMLKAGKVQPPAVGADLREQSLPSGGEGASRMLYGAGLTVGLIFAP